MLITNPGWTRRFVEEHDCGWWIDALDAEGLASALVSIFENPAELRRKGQRGATIARRLFDRQHMADDVEAIITRLTREKNAG